ncbi:DUF3040 domain-containing protein [Actinoplanes sp. NPDC048791]|uniref:DUF3040 domain-containing protein n=1 Tax=Actinoplanes sp. NPDC048791 TaxID=3154623 RepID=UPI0033CCF4FE
MLNDAEQRRLTQIEQELRSDDPAFTQPFGRLPLRSPQEWRGMTARGWLLAAALVMGFAVLMGSRGMALIAVGAAAVSGGIWLAHELRSPDDRQPPRP